MDVMCNEAQRSIDMKEEEYTLNNIKLISITVICTGYKKDVMKTMGSGLVAQREQDECNDS